MKTNIKLIIGAILLTGISLSIWSFKKKSTFLNNKPNNNVNDSLFNSYWYAGKAEIKTYDLIQSRYGELHKGMATVIFVTEPFLVKEGVKPDNPTKNQIPVLKMNLLKKFGTGIYPYSMMLSTFTPLQEVQLILISSIVSFNSFSSCSFKSELGTASIESK